MKLRGEVFPQVLDEVGKGLEKAISQQISLINKSIKEEITTQQKTLEQAMTDVRCKMDEEKEQKDKLECDILATLDRIGEIKNGL